MSALPAATTIRAALQDTSQVGEARRVVGLLCRGIALSEADAGRAAIVATEAASNVVRHGGGGELLVQPLAAPARGLEIIALDRGPGIVDLTRALADGHSTGGSPGTGLGAMRRLSSRFDAYTRPGQGTALLMQIRVGEAPMKPIEPGAICLAKPGEEECGDVWTAQAPDGSLRILVADGLGHGPLAREAALTAVAAADGSKPGLALERAHLASRATRGAAMAIADVELASGSLRYAGLGNVGAVLVDAGGPHNLVSMNGTLGQGPLKPREFEYQFKPGALLVMWSDGLVSRWSFESYPGLITRDPTLVAAVLYRDHARGRDDTTVVVARLGRAS